MNKYKILIIGADGLRLKTRALIGIMPISADKLYAFGTLLEPKDKYCPVYHWPELMVEKFNEFAEPAHQFLEKLDETSEVLYTQVEEVALDGAWNRGRILLISDEAHAPTAFMGQGGAMAIQNAVSLGQLLNCNLTLNESLQKFIKLRQPICKFVQDISRAVGRVGAQEDLTNLNTRNAHLQKNSQNYVDNFY